MNLRGRVGLVLGGVIVGAIAVVVLRDSGDDEPAATRPAERLSARIELTDDTVAAGGSIDGEVIVTNNTGEAVEATGCGSLFQVALAQDEYEPLVGWDDCLEEFTIPTGESTYPVRVRAHHLGCVDGSGSGNIISCEPDGSLPPLAQGDYEARLYQASPVVPEAPPVAVQVQGEP